MFVELHPTFENESVFVNVNNIIIVRKEEPRSLRGEREHELGSDIVFIGNIILTVRESKEEIKKQIEKALLN